MVEIKQGDVCCILSEKDIILDYKSKRSLLLLHEHVLLATAEDTGTTGGDETDLGTSRTIATDRRGVTNVLVVTTPVRVLNRVHSHTTHLRPAVALNLVLVVAGTSLKHRLVATTTTRDLTDRRAATRRNRLLRARRELDTGEARVKVVGDQDAVLTGRLGQGTAVTELGLDVANDRTLRHGAERQNVTDRQLRLLTGVHELTGVRTFRRDEELLLEAVTLGVTESHLFRGKNTSKSVSVARSCPFPARSSDVDGRRAPRTASVAARKALLPTRDQHPHHHRHRPLGCRASDKNAPWPTEHLYPGRG